MKLKATLTLGIIASVLTLSAWAGDDRYRHGYRDHDRGRVVIRIDRHERHKFVHRDNHWRGDKHWRGHCGKHFKPRQWRDRHHPGYRGHRYGHRRHHRGDVYVIRKHDDDIYKWIGGAILLREILDHDHH